MITGFTFSLVIAVAVVGSVPSASARREQFDLEDLMNKFLTEYDTKATDPQHQPVAHQENIDFDHSEPESYFPDAIEEQSYYSEPQEYYQEPQEQSSFYPEPHHEMEQEHQHLHQHPNQPPHQHPHQHPHHPRHPHQHKQQEEEMSGYNRYKDSPSSEQSSSQQKQQQQAAPSTVPRQVQPSAGESEEQEESLDPKLRDFTLIISKLLFQLSQL